MRRILRAFIACLPAALVFGQTDAPKYTGPGSCASPACHGGVSPKDIGTGTRANIQQNEYSTWVVKDKHAREFSVLTNPTATRMAKILNIDRADKAQKCLVCHSLSVTDEQRTRSFDSSDGVSCESCHGPASNWLGQHTTKDWTHERSVAAGMKDLRDPAHRTENCVSCHLGTADKTVDHEMIAAGHPDLYFELASFSAAMPEHWRPRATSANAQGNVDPWADVRALAVGQAVHLREQLNRVARNAQSPHWPEFSDLDCYACHHSLTTSENSWQQERGYAGRRAGDPPWNMARFATLRQIAREVDGGRELETEVNRIYSSVTAMTAGRTQLASQATGAAEAAGRVAAQLATETWDATRARRLLKAISGDADYISRQGERTAEQAAMVLQALYSALATQARPANDAQVRGALKALFQQVENPSAYNAFRFAAQMRTLNGLLP